MKYPPDLPMRICFEDNHLLVVNKRPGEMVQADKTGDIPLSEHLKAYIKEKYHKPGRVYLGVVHRLDRPVSGLVIFARTSKALARLNRMLKDREMEKHYWAVVKQKPEQKAGQLTHYLLKNEKQNKSYVASAKTPGAKLASMDYRLLGSGNHYHLLEIHLHTGRHHQIRAQLAAMGSPVKGDLKYGFSRANDNGSIHLHARFLSFVHPVSQERLHLVAPVPQEDPLWKVFESLTGS